jgi:Domain of unknown function (DUF4430)
MRTTIATLAVVSLVSIWLAPAAQGAPTEVNVRIEGKTETLFEGPILTDGHKIRASSDKKARTCDGTNNGQNPAPRPTPIVSSVDAMSILGKGFDGQWYNQYDDYFIKQWGPDGQDEAHGEYWGILVNNVYTNVGGCQYQLDAGDEVLWAYDAFKEKPLLALFPAGYTEGVRPLTATAELNQPFEVEVDAYEDDLENTPPASPERDGASPFAGATVAPVVSTVKGFEGIATESAEAKTTGADGKATFIFHTYGWHRIKATRLALGGAEDAIRSNRLDVCVPEPPAADCGALPVDDEVRKPPTVVLPPDDPEPENPAPSGGGSPAFAGKAILPAPQNADPVKLQLPRLDRSQIARGLVGISWRVLDPGAGIKKWMIASKRLGAKGKGARYITRAQGTTKTSTMVRLPLGATYKLKITIVDMLGRSSSASIGKVRVPSAGP